VAGLATLLLLSKWANPLRLTPFENPPEVLAQKARDLIVRAGYADPPADRAWHFRYFTDFLQYAERSENREDYRTQIVHGEPSPLLFWYRQSPQYLAPYNGDANVSQTDPPNTLLSGRVSVRLHPQGQLHYFHAVPPQRDESSASPLPFDWDTFFAAAGLDRGRFTPSEPSWVPPAAFDARAAWTGSFAHTPSIPLRVETASWKGRPVYFQVIGPWTLPDRMEAVRRTASQRAGQWIILGLISAVCLAAALLAWRNYRLGRSDMSGSSRLAAFVLICSWIRWLCSAHHLPVTAEFVNLTWGLSSALYWTALCWVLYMALEPYVRRRWPQCLITWTRVLSGGTRDPLVASIRGKVP
jgi:hypothetical protein